MLSKLLPHLKPPYATAIISITWLGAVLFFAIDPDMNLVAIMASAVLVTLLVALHAFRSK